MAEERTGSNAAARLRHMVCVAAALVVMAGFCGCGGEAEEKQMPESPKEIMRWQGQEFAPPEEPKEGERFYLTGYEEGLGQVPEEQYPGCRISTELCGVREDTLYLYSEVWNYEAAQDEDGSETVLVNVKGEYIGTYDVKTGEGTSRELKLDVPEFPKFSARGQELAGAGEMMYYDFTYDDSGAVEQVRVVYADLEGNVRKCLDIGSAFQEFGIELPISNSFFDCVRCDSQGYLYLCDPNAPRVGVVDESGELVCVMEPPVSRAGGASCSMRSDDGRVFFEASGIMDGEKSRVMFRYDPEAGEMDIVGKERAGNGTTLSYYMDSYGDIWYSTTQELVRWNWSTGKREKVFRLKENGINADPYSQCVFIDSQGRLFFVGTDTATGRVQLCSLSQTQPDYENEIRIVDAAGIEADSYLQWCAAVYSRKHPLCHVSYELEDRERAVNELVSGKGADILVVDREDMENLWGKGALADLSDVLDSKTQEQIFPAVLESGRIDGRLYGLANGISGWPIYVSEKLWQKDTWTVEEFVNLVESLEGQLDAVFVSQLSPAGGIETFLNIAMRDLETSPFIDWQNGKCHFDDPLFSRVLELSARYGGEAEQYANMDSEERANRMIQMLQEGRAIAYLGFGLGDIGTFSDELAALGEDYFCVGFPTSKASGIFTVSGDVMVLNAATLNRDAAEDFLRFCYEADSQKQADTSTVSRELVRERVQQDYAGNWVYRYGNGGSLILKTKPDGSSWMEEYLECMDKAVPLPVKSEEVYNIIWEEVEPFFAGERDEASTVEALQNRVQLWLDEHSS